VGFLQNYIILGDSCSSTRVLATFKHLYSQLLEFTGRIGCYKCFYSLLYRFYRYQLNLQTIYRSLDRDFFTDTEYSCFFCMFYFKLIC